MYLIYLSIEFEQVFSGIKCAMYDGIHSGVLSCDTLDDLAEDLFRRVTVPGDGRTGRIQQRGLCVDECCAGRLLIDILRRQYGLSVFPMKGGPVDLWLPKQ